METPLSRAKWLQQTRKMRVNEVYEDWNVAHFYNRYSPRDLETLAQPVHRIVTRKPQTLSADARVDDAVAMFNTHNISCIPIVDDAGVAVGIVSWRDILKSLAAWRRETAPA